MLKEERQAFILKQINLHNKVLSSQLAASLGVSEDTILRDLKELASKGSIVKVHGGAVSPSFYHPLNHHVPTYATEAKKQIAQKVITLIKKDMVVLTGGGTTMIELAKAVPDSLRATFFTISPLVAIELVAHPNLTVITIGGELSKGSYVHIGASVINQLRDLQADLCLLGTNGLSIDKGITDSDWEIVQVKKAMIQASEKTAILCISEKLDSYQKFKVCALESIHYLITELPPASPLLQPYAQKQLRIL
ncbi:MAG: DeoR/GlpR transcriptional regulator [Thermoflavifilum sp.]|nr:DeoR/GlpR transcriptional regulator [Thermoflavifilum sp.]